MIIGLSGYARSGKDESATVLAELGYERLAFADKLREFLFVLNPVVIPRSQPAFEPIFYPCTVQEVIERFGWGGYKESPYAQHMREYLQRLGTECGRGLIGHNVWVDATFRGMNAFCEQHYTIADVRFPNEARAIVERGGIIVRIDRPGVGPTNDHPSETALDDWRFDYVVQNDRGIEWLHQVVKAIGYAHLPFLVE